MDCDTFLKEHPKAMLFHISQDEFDHGKTRNLAVSNSDAEVFVCMTQDALPADAYLTQELCKALFSDEKIAVAYARQLPEENCSRMERYTRQFNYPEQRRSKQRRIFWGSESRRIFARTSAPPISAIFLNSSVDS